MTDKEFCKLDTAFYGEEVDHIKQIALRTFNGEELKEYVEHCIKLHLLNIPDVVGQSEQLPCEHPYHSIIGEEHGNPKCLKCGKNL